MPKSNVTDEMLRFEMEQGLSASQIAAKYGLRRQSVHERVRKLNLTTAAVATIAPIESRNFVRNELDVLQHLVRSLQRVELLADACDRWMRDADDPTRYDLGPRTNEVMVTYFETGDEVDDEGIARTRRVKKPLHILLRMIERGGFAVDSAEIKVADTRDLTLKTAGELRQTVQSAVDLAARLADVRAMQALREAILTEIAKVSPEVAENIARSVRRILVLHGSVGEPGDVASS